MIVEPYKAVRPAPPRLALLLADGRTVLEETGELTPLADLPAAVHVWAAQERTIDLLRAGEGQALCWRGQPIRYEPEGYKGFRVRVLGLGFPDRDDDSLRGLVAWRDWLAEHGAAPQGSLGSSSMSLLRATLERKLWCTAPQEQAPPIAYTVGGRQELGPAGAPAEVGDAQHVDLRAAYARTLAGIRYGGHWHELRNDLRRLRLFARDHPLFCRARVALTGSSPGPLVRRERKAPEGQLAEFPVFPPAGRLQGIWTWQELEAARRGGARVEILAAWGHASAGWQPFLPWWRAVEAGREELTGFGRLLAKATGNSLWGQFCIQPAGKRSILRYERRRGSLRLRVVVLEGKAGPRPAHDLSELLTGIVRAELYGMMLAAGSRLVSAHTDGGWIAGGERLELGEHWRVKARAERLRVLDPQMLAYRVSGESDDRFVVAGWPARLAGQQFERLWGEASAA